MKKHETEIRCFSVVDERDAHILHREFFAVFKIDRLSGLGY